MVKVLSWCNARAADGMPTSTISLCYDNISSGFYSTNGSAWAVQAIDSGIFTVMLQSGQWLSLRDHRDLVKRLVDFLSKLWPKYLVFRSVLRAVRKSIRKVKKLGLTTAATAGPLWDAWRGFQELAEERLSMLDAWDKEGGRSVLHTCSRPQVRRVHRFAVSNL